jgi:hypothetical protein
MKQQQYCDMSRDARVLILSQRAWNQLFYMPLNYEFEDLITSVDAAHILAPPFLPFSPLAQIIFRGRKSLRARYGLLIDPGIPAIELERDYDLFFCLLNFAYETPSLRCLEGLRRRCKRAVCMFTEIWTSHVSRFRRSLEILNQLEFDHVFVNLSSSLPAFKGVVHRPCSFLPLAVDALRFTPGPDAPARVIDYYSMGRRSEVTHQALMRLAAARGGFYYFDSAVHPSWRDCFDHRELLANLLHRTRYLMVHKPSLRPDLLIGADEALPGRLFEGAAAGTIMLGTVPEGADFDRHFNWPDAVIPVPFDCSRIGAVIDALEREPDRLARARENNVVQALLRHDWSYRWQRILEAAKMAPLAGLSRRHSKLQEMAVEASDSRAGCGSAAG